MSILDRLPPAVQAQVRAAYATGAERVSIADVAVAGQGDELLTTADDLAERDIQTAAEQDLAEAGFWAATNKVLELAAHCCATGQQRPVRGWYEHRPSMTDQGMPLALDLRIMPFAGPMAHVEIKAAKTAVTPQQRQFLTATPNAYLVRGIKQWRAFWQAYLDGAALVAWRYPRPSNPKEPNDDAA